MAISAQEAQGIKFTEDRRGYAAREVDAFRERVVKTLRTYEAELAKANERLVGARERIQDLEDAEEAVKRTFLAASRTKREMEEEATAEADRILGEARAEAQRVSADATAEADRAKGEAAQEAAQKRSEAERDAQRMLSEARAEADRAAAHTKTEAERLERRLGQLRNAVADLEQRLKTFAEGALDEVAVVSGLIELESTSLDELDHFDAPQVAGMPAAVENAARDIE